MVEFYTVKRIDNSRLVRRRQGGFLRTCGRHLMIAGVLVALTIMLFIGDWRTTIIASLAILLILTHVRSAIVVCTTLPLAVLVCRDRRTARRLVLSALAAVLLITVIPFQDPQDVLGHPNGKLYIANGMAISVYDAATHAFLGYLGDITPASRFFSYIHRMSIDAAGNIYAVDQVAKASSVLLNSLVTSASPRDREVEAAKASGAKVMCFASTESIASRMIEYGTDALILEGSEAGGHIGHVSTMVLIQEVLFRFGQVPVFVAGGLGRGEAKWRQSQKG